MIVIYRTRLRQVPVKNIQRERTHCLVPTLANICKGKAIDSRSAPPNMVPNEPPVCAKGKHIEIGSTSRTADRKRKISAFYPTLKESTEVEWSPRAPRSSKVLDYISPHLDK